MTVNATAQHGEFLVTVIVTSPIWQENCYLVRHIPSRDTLIIDPGDDADRILQAIQADGGTPREILLTHGHPDHIGAVAALQESLNLPCRVHVDEAPLLATVSDFARHQLGFEVVAPKSVVTFTTNQVFDLGGQSFTAIPTPGHTPGGVTYNFGAFALTGDTIFNHGIGRTDLPGGSGIQLAQSIDHLLSILPDHCTLYCGHGPAWSAGEARLWWSAMRGWDNTL